MARRGCKQNDIVENIETLIENIIGSDTLGADALERISNRADNVKKLIRNGSTRNWSTDDPREVTQLVSIVLEEFIYAAFDSDEHKDLASTLVKIVESDDYDSNRKPNNGGGFRGNKNKDRNSKKPRVEADTEEYFKCFYNFLSTNKYTTRPSFATFVKCVEKFNLRKQCIEPALSTQDLYNQWDLWVINR